jgi:hypothetical protein
LGLVVLIRLRGRRARRGTWSVGPVSRGIGAIPMAAPKLASACSLATESEGLGIVQVIDDFVVRGANRLVARCFEGGQNDSPKHIVTGECFHVGESFAGVADFQEVVIDSVHSVAIPCHEAAEFTSKKLDFACACE